MPTVKHPETIHVWGCFSVKGVGSLTTLPKYTAMKKIMVPTIQEQFGDGAPCHKAKLITKWLGKQNYNILVSMTRKLPRPIFS
jgi:hypothetical protein